MIHLDANYLILGAQKTSREAFKLQRWLESDEALAASAIAWMEFVTGPVQMEMVDAMRQAIGERIAAFGRDESELAAELFNMAGRRRGLRYDCMIAAAAINAGAALATTNFADFRLFVPHGLRLVGAD